MNRDFIDYYKVLGVDPNLPSGLPKNEGDLTSELKTAFRKLAKEFHSDKLGGETKATAEAFVTQDEMFKEISAAWSVLRDPGNRATYNLDRKAYYNLPEAERDKNDARVKKAREDRLKDAIEKERIRREADEEAKREREDKSKDGKEETKTDGTSTDSDPEPDDGPGADEPTEEKRAADEARKKAEEAENEARREREKAEREEREAREAREAAERDIREAAERARIVAEVAQKVTWALSEFRRLEEMADKFSIHAEIARERLTAAKTKTAEAEGKATKAGGEKTTADENKRLAEAEKGAIEKILKDVETAEKAKIKADQDKADAIELAIKATTEDEETAAGKAFEDAEKAIVSTEKSYRDAIKKAIDDGATPEKIREVTDTFRARAQEAENAAGVEQEAKRLAEEAKRAEDEIAREVEIVEEVEKRSLRESERARQIADNAKREAMEGITDPETKRLIREKLDEIIKRDIEEGELRAEARRADRERTKEDFRREPTADYDPTDPMGDGTRMHEPGFRPSEEGTPRRDKRWGGRIREDARRAWKDEVNEVKRDINNFLKGDGEPIPSERTGKLKDDQAAAKEVRNRMRGEGGEGGT